MWRVLSILAIPLNALLALANMELPAVSTAESSGRIFGRILGVIIVPLLVVALFSISRNFRSTTFRWKIIFLDTRIRIRDATDETRRGDAIDEIGQCLALSKPVRATSKPV